MDIERSKRQLLRERPLQARKYRDVVVIFDRQLPTNLSSQNFSSTPIQHCIYAETDPSLASVTPAAFTGSVCENIDINTDIDMTIYTPK